MRKLYITILSGLLLGLSSCADTFLDLEPQDKRTNVVYFKKPADFKEYATGFITSSWGGAHRMANTLFTSLWIPLRIWLPIL